MRYIIVSEGNAKTKRERENKEMEGQVNMRYVVHYNDGDVDAYTEFAQSVECAQEHLDDELRGCIAEITSIDLYIDNNGEMGKFIDSVARN